MQETRYYCDNCEKELIEDTDFMYAVRFFEPVSFGTGILAKEREILLCKDCYEKYKELTDSFLDWDIKINKDNK